MTHPTEINIPNDSIIIKFKEHLDLELNQRILFTAPFGAGKSTFINDFKNQYKDEYRFIRLYPVNYAVSANEDIFELIKFDILNELLTHYQDEINLELEDFNFWLRMSMFIQGKSDLMPLFLLILSQNEKIGKSAAIFIGALEKALKPIKKSFKEYSEQIKIDELGDISKFLESLKNKIGNHHEMNGTSQFIYDLVGRLKGIEVTHEESVAVEDIRRKHKTVLVIDDLDRLDPEHIFRLFNIFSAHTYEVTGENKFGFDKILFVCDIENIRKIYAHKYGEGVDFSGYMDKFYSIKPFEFDHEEHLINQLNNFIESYNFKNTDNEFIRGDYFIDGLTGLLKIMLDQRIINLRSLQQVKDLTFDLNANRNSNYKGAVFPAVILLKILKEILGGLQVLEQGLLLMAANNKQNAYSSIPNYRSNYKYKYNLTSYEYKALVASFIVFQGKNMIEGDNKFDFERKIKKCFINKLGVSVFYNDDTYNYTRKINITNICEGDCRFDEIEQNVFSRVELSIPNLMINAFNYLKENQEL